MDAEFRDQPASAGPAAKRATPQPPAKPADDAKDNKKRGRPKDFVKTKQPPKEKQRKVTRDSKAKALHVDVDRQCGVPIVDAEGEPTGALCSRSMTCKSHSMAAKRAVTGRSQPYDVLLAAYQQKHHLKAATGGGAGAAAAKLRAAAAASRVAALTARAAESESEDEPPLPDSEEIAQVIHGAMLSTPRPLDVATIMPTRLRNHHINLSEMLYKAIANPGPLPAATGPLATVMSSTEALYGHCIVYETNMHTQSMRPSQIYAYQRLSQRAPVDPRTVAAAAAAGGAPGQSRQAPPLHSAPATARAPSAAVGARPVSATVSAAPVAADASGPS